MKTTLHIPRRMGGIHRDGCNYSGSLSLRAYGFPILSQEEPDDQKQDDSQKPTN
jgi:hypothetical protein